MSIYKQEECHTCPNPAEYTCDNCGANVCSDHVYFGYLKQKDADDWVVVQGDHDHLCLECLESV